jgi:hypothetical protein
MYRRYNTTVGALKIHDAFLSFIRIKKIKREGVGFDIVYTAGPTNRQVYHKMNTGELFFAQPFALNEKIYVML